MNDPRNSEKSNDRLIQLLQAGQPDSIPEKMLAELSHEELEEFFEARQAIEILDRFKPLQTNDQSAADQAEIESATMQLDVTPVMATDRSAETVPAIEKLGHYEILETLGQGGFGVVVKARDTKLGRYVALKVPRAAALFEGETRERFAREARLVAMLSHPAIVPIYETGSEGSILFIASAFCDGGTLARWFSDSKKSISPTMAAKIVSRLAEAVQHAHVRGVVHRDLKPGNVLLHFDGANPRGNTDAVIAALRITDFGLAKFEASDQTLTRTGATIGTPAYMSPEQARGKPGKVGPAADIYGLGAILYELLTGKPPILEDSHVATMRAIETKIPPGPHRINPDVSRDLAAICLKCLEKEPKHQYADSQQLHDDLENFLQHRPVVARPTGKLTQFGRWCRRNPGLAGMSMLAFGSLAIGLLLVSWQWQIAQDNLAESNRQGERALGHLGRAEGAIDEMLTDVAESLRNVPQTTALRERLLKQALELQQEILRAEQDELASLRTVDAHRRIGKIQFELGKLDESIENYNAALNVLEQMPEESSDHELLLKQGQLLRLLGHAFYQRDDRDAISNAAQQAVLALETANTLQPTVAGQTELANAHRLLGMSLQRERKMNEAVAEFQQSVDLLTEIKQSDNHGDWRGDLSRVHNSLAIGQKAIGQNDEAVENYLASIDYAREAVNDQPDNVELRSQMATTALNLGNLMSYRKEYQAAQEYYELSFNTFSKLANDFPGVGRYLKLASLASGGLGVAQRRTGQPDQAASSFQESIDLLLQLERDFGLIPSERMELGGSYQNLGSVLGVDLDNWEEGRGFQERAVEIARALTVEFPERDDYWRSLSLNLGNLGASMITHGDPVEAALDLHVEATSAGMKAYQSNPSNPLYRSNLKWQIGKLSRAHLVLGQEEGIKSVVDRWISLTPDSAQTYQDAIVALTGLIVHLESVHQLDEEQKTTVANRIANWAIDLIEYAQQKGLLDANALASVKSLEPLFSYERFQDLIGK